VCEKEIGDIGEPLAGLAVFVGDRLVGAIAARHHERSAEVRDQQMVQRRVRQHEAEPRRPRCDRRRDGGI
jgi:hypothetical protein